MPRKGPKSQKLTIYLAKTGKSKTGDLLDDPKSLSRHSVKVANKKIGDLYVASPKSRPPGWQSFFSGHVSPTLPGLRNASTSAVFLASTSKRTFAVTFGHGRHLLAPGAWEEDLGLRVTLNAISEDGIKSVDRRSFEGLSRQIRTQAVREASFADIGLDVEQEVLRQVAGNPGNADVGARLVGMESLNATVKVALPDLPSKLDRYLSLYRSTKYRKRFPWADYFRELTDPTSIDRLNGALIRRLTKGELDRVWLAAPEIIDWSDVSGFRYRGGKKELRRDDLHVGDLLSSLDVDNLTIESLKSGQVSCYNATDDAVRHRWTWFRCLYAEVDEAEATFLLTDGKWYRIAKSVVDEVNNAIRQMRTGPVLPKYEDTSEAAYCERVARSDQKRYALMDRKNISYGGAHSKVEFCDLFAEGKRLIHVKRYGGSSVLSHLFSQGVVSAELFAAEKEFRKKVNAKLPSGHKLKQIDKHPTPDDLEVVYAITSASAKPLKQSLPFFSRVTLRNAARRFRAAGYRVSLTKIEV